MACCGDSGGCYRPDEAQPASAPAESRYPAAPRDDAPVADPRQWARAPNAVDQFASYGKVKTTDTPPYENDYTYTGQYLAACHFPLGGFGCGQVTLSGDGTLTGWTVLNQGHNAERTPLSKMPANWFGVAATPAGGSKQAFVLATPQNYTPENMARPTREEAHVSMSQADRLRTLPGIKGLSIRGTYPIADVAYEIDGFPVTVSMECLTPLIPGDTVSSAIPAAMFTFTFKSTAATATEVQLMHAQQNLVGWSGDSDATSGSTPYWGGNVNTPYVAADGSHAGMSLTNPSVDGSSAAAGNLAVVGVHGGGVTTTVIPAAASETDLWSAFTANQGVNPGTASPSAPSAAGKSPCTGVIQSVSVPAGGTVSVTFVLSWYFPNRMRNSCVGARYEGILPPVLGNRYATFYTDAKDAARYYVEKASSLNGTTQLYTKTIFGSTIPPTVLDSAAGRLACWRSATMWWSKDGIVMGCEGNRCCPLNCSHVYGYTVLLERMFPSLGKDMAYSSFVRNYIAGSGVSMRFRTGGWAIDGALASVIKAYLCVRQADPDGTWLKSVWPNVKDQMVIIMTNFDLDEDGCIRNEQQNTYDTAMQGANTFIGSYYVTALRATSKMASLVGDDDFAAKTAARATLASKSYDTICWKEEFGYFIADVNENNCAHSYGPGCFVDQICAAGLSCCAGLGYCFPNPQHEQSARLAIAKYNKVTAPPFQDMQHHFYPGDSGITVCTYPNGKLKDGMQYTNLVSAGFTSPVIAGLIFDGTEASLAAALDVVGYIRNRQDGRTASPWNEPECNILYSRSMAHWNLFDQACGQNFDATRGYLAFNPKWNKTAFKCFVTVQTGWGEYTQTGNVGLTSGTATLSALYGTIEISILDLPFQATKATATLGGSAVPATFTHGALVFGSKVVIPAGSTLTVTLTSNAEVASCGPPGCCSPLERAQCCPPPAAASASDGCCAGGKCGAELRQRCGLPTEKSVIALEAAGQLQDAPTTTTTVVVLPTARRQQIGAFCVFLFGTLLGLYLPTILRMLQEAYEGQW